MFVTIINDCKDDNARARQESRVASLCDATISFIGVDSDLEAGMQLLDILDATEGRPGLVLVNVAPRGGHTTKWENGTPFGYFWYQDTLILSSVDGLALAGAKHFDILPEVALLSTRTAAPAMAEAGFISDEAAAHIPFTQFRSFDFIPRAGVFLLLGNDLPYEPYELTDIPDLPAAIWHIDNFGNCKTTLTPERIASAPSIKTRFGDYQYINRLRDLPDNESGLVRGSSGLHDTRLLELMHQRGNFAALHNVQIGDDLFSEQSHFIRATN